jgi:pyridoxamine 5'-phosphate oxidase
MLTKINNREFTMNTWRTLADIRREYGELHLSETEALANPFAQFKLWFEEVLEAELYDPTAMVLSTVDDKGFPDSRVVLLKGFDDDAFIFYSNYQSTKAMQMQATPYAALNFYWPHMARQVRIRGRVKHTTAKRSDDYFASRPLISQLSAIASPQSHAITNRQILEETLTALVDKQGQQPIVRPEHWGGYTVNPDEIEFWQGRDNRLHDRVHYYKEKGQWCHRRLAP